MVVEKYLELRSQLGTILGSLIALAHQIGAPEVTLCNLQALSANLGQPFLFVVVGEVKAGKSSLLNALFGQDFCKVDVLPATDRIYEFKYGETSYDVQISDHITELHRPIDFLKDFNIVDTPGTNTIVANHQEITENFVPMADLIVFVFAVTNPWAASAWDFLKLIGRQWKKNIVFVVQQADLRDPHEVDIVSRHLDQTVLQILGANCPIFAVSAKKALLAKTGPEANREKLWSESNFGPLEDWITKTVSRSEERGGKLLSVAQTAQVVAGGLRARVQGALDLLKSDTEKLASIRSTFEARKAQSHRQVGGFIREIEQAYDACRERGEKALEKRLTIGQTFKMVLSSGRWEKDFQDQVQSEVKTEVEKKMELALSLLESDLRSMWQDLQDKVSVQFGSESKKQVRAMVAGFLTQRQEILQRLQLTLIEQMSDARIKEQLQALFGETARWLRVPTSMAAAGGIATIIAALTHTALLDVTGTVAGLAALTGTLYAVWRRRKILHQYRDQMSDKRRDLTRALETQLNHAIDAFYHEVALTFSPLEAFCDSEFKRHAPLKDHIDDLDQKIGAIKNQLG
ncbi:MAG TPA: dynamin family protein [Chthoniobacterales bacterium]|nr:dynamin family protein [Chthoniobacterales bacterium]